MTLKMVNAFYLSIQFFGHKQPGKCVLFKFVFHIEHHWAHLDVVFHTLNLFFHLQITSVCKKHTSPVNKKTDQLSALVEKIKCFKTVLR